MTEVIQESICILLQYFQADGLVPLSCCNVQHHQISPDFHETENLLIKPLCSDTAGCYCEQVAEVQSECKSCLKYFNMSRHWSQR